MLNICITADHELFFGQNYASEEAVLIRPTYRLMKVLEEFNIPLCLMTDVCSINKYRESNITKCYVPMIERQLCYALENGHDVQLHIHPHWLNSEYTDGQWKFNYANYRLHSLGFDLDSEQGGRRIIADGKRYLEDLLKPVLDSYKCVAFRAGGWCIQPEKEFLEALLAEDIRIETTVYNGGFSNTGHQFFDFRHLPNKPNWWIDPQKGLGYEAKRSDGCLLEVAIGSYGFLPLVGLKKLLYKPYRLSLKGSSDEVRGCGMLDFIGRSKLKRIADEIQRIFFQPIVFTFDSACSKVMVDFVNYYLMRFDCSNQEIYVSIIGHPKALTTTSLDEIRKFCMEVTGSFSEKVRFIRLRDIPL